MRKRQNSERTLGEWTEIFVDAVLKHHEYMCKNSNEANLQYDRLKEAWSELAKHGDDGYSALAQLLSHKSAVVRSMAGTCLIPFRSKEVIPVLKAAASESDPLALVTLKRWEKGFYVDPFTNKEIKHTLRRSV
jgi:hypothetical protein